MPWKPDPNTCRVECVLSTEERTALGHAALDAGMSISAYCARAIMAHEPLVEAMHQIDGLAGRNLQEGRKIAQMRGLAQAALAKAKGVEK